MKITILYAVAVVLAVTAGIIDVTKRPEIYGPFLPDDWKHIGGSK